MSEVTPLTLRPARVRTVRGFAVWAAFGGLGACGTENTHAGSTGNRASQVSTDTAQTQVNGQSGTEYRPGGGGDLHPSCPCDYLINPLRGTVLEVQGHIEGRDGFPVRLGTVRLRVDGLLGNTTGLEIGSEISSPWFGSLPCFFGCASVAVGDEVLAFYQFPYACIDTSGDDCPLGDIYPGGIALTPWSDTPVLARLSKGDFTLAVEDLPLLDSPECGAQIGDYSELVGSDELEPVCFERQSPAP